MRKGQTEIIGIVIIVLIVTIALLIYIANATNEDLSSGGSKLYDEYTSNEVATSFVQSFLNTYVPECTARIEEVIIDCGRSRKTLNCGSKDSCEIIEDTLDIILPQTINKWDYAYGLEITYSPTKNLSYSTYDCGRETVGRAAPGVFLLPYYPEPGTARFELGFCS